MRRILLLMLCALIVGVTATAQSKTDRSQSIINIAGESFYVHKVKAGETLYSLSKLYDVAQEEIQKYNPAAVESLQEGMVLKIPAVRVTNVEKLNQRQKSRLYEEHIVNQGETAYAIAKRYGISIALLTEDNPGTDITTLSIGQRLNIRKSGIGDTKESDIKQELVEYKDAMNSVIPHFKYHLVEKGDTFYNISKKYEVDQYELMKINDIATNDGLKLGAMIKIPVKVNLVLEKVAEQEQKSPILQVSDRYDVESLATSDANEVNLAILLPLSDKSAGNFLEFYQGALLALEDLKTEGHAVNVNLYNTNRSSSEVQGIVNDLAFRRSNLIIGPVYEETADAAVKFAEENRVPIVSPLATFDQTSSSALYQMSPNNDTKYDKLKQFLTDDKNIIVVSAANNDAEFDKEISAILPADHKRFVYSKAMSPLTIEEKLSPTKENVFVVLASNEFNVDEILARISSIQNNMLARSIPVGRISVVGTSRWSRFNNIDKNLFFKLNLRFVSSYYADSNSAKITDFNKRYTTAFNVLPSLYAYRGYDAVKLFVGAMNESGSTLTQNLNSYPQHRLLSMPYRFERDEKSNVNQDWAMVVYQNNYTIEVK